MDQLGSLEVPSLKSYGAYLILDSRLEGLTESLSGLQLLQRHIRDLPVGLRPYFQGIIHYNLTRHAAGEEAKENMRLAYENFELARSSCYEFLNANWFVRDSSIRGVNAGTSYETAASLLDWSFSGNASFCDVVEKTPDCVPASSRAHIVGCDQGYFDRYFEEFYKDFKASGAIGDIVVLLADVSDVSEVSSKYTDVRFFTASLNVKDKKSMYTALRFEMAKKLIQEGVYKQIVCSDVDVKFRENYNSSVSAIKADIGIMFNKAARIPWRGGADAKFVVLNPELGGGAAKVVKFVSALVSHAYRPKLTALGNRQWWMDQFALALAVDGSRFGIDSFVDVSVHHIERSDSPIVSAGMMGLSKEEFFKS